MQIVSAEEKVALEKKRQDLYNAKLDVQDRIRKAAALGDLSENAEYHFAKEENRSIERELAELESKLRHVQVVSTDNIPQDMVFLGHTVKLLDLDDDSETVIRLVGEAQPPSGNSEVTDVLGQQPHGRRPHEGPRRRHGQGEGPARDDGVQDPRDPVTTHASRSGRGASRAGPPARRCHHRRPDLPPGPYSSPSPASHEVGQIRAS